MNKISIIITIVLVVLIIVFFAIYKPINNENKITNTTETSIVSNTNKNILYKLSEIALHNTEKDCWMVINKKVYNATDFIASGQHNKKILEGCGKDATSFFANVDKHSSEKVQIQLSKLLIGTLDISMKIK